MEPQKLIGFDVQARTFVDMQTGKACSQKEIRDFIDYLFRRYNIDSQELKIYYSPIEQVWKSKLTNDTCDHKMINDELSRVLSENSMKQSCTPKEWDGCRVEKMGCEGCTYDVNKSKVVLFPKHKLTTKEEPINQHPDMVKLTAKVSSLEAAINATGEMLGVILKELDPSKCRHCGGDQPAYCETCYQLLINKIMCLQATEHDHIAKNSVLEFMDALRNILLNGEIADSKLNKIQALYIQYIKEFDN